LKLKYTLCQIALARALGLKWAFEALTRPSDSLNWHKCTTSLESVYTPPANSCQCFKCHKEGHIAYYCPFKNWTKTQDQDWTAKYERPAPTEEPSTILERLVHALRRLTTMDEESQKFLDLVVKKGLVTTAQIKELATAIKIWAFYLNP